MILVLDERDVRELAVLLHYLKTHLEARHKEHKAMLGAKDPLTLDEERWAQQSSNLWAEVMLQLRREVGDGPPTEQ